MAKNLLPVPDDPKLVMLDVAKAVNRAKRKHPYFCKRLFVIRRVEQCEYTEKSCKDLCAALGKNVTAEDLFGEEMAEAATANAKHDTKQLYNELLDVAAVVVRMAETVAKGGAK